MSIDAGIRYLRECYREDAVRGGYWNINAKSVEHRVVFEGEEQLVDDVVTTLVIPPNEKVGRLVRDVLLKRGEREFLYGSLFVAGRLSGSEDGVSRVLCSPLILIPLKIDDPESGIVEVDIGARRLNSALLDALTDAAGVENITDALAGEFDGSALSAATVLRLEASLREHIPLLDVAPMAAYPQLLGKSEFKAQVGAATKEIGERLRLLPASVAALWPKSNAARGIISELAMMADAGNFSPPVEAVLGAAELPEPAPTMSRSEVLPVPAVLSVSQKEILRSASEHVLTLAHGPPGTGKSYTIAAVALDHLSRSESVLIASKTDHAVDVIGDKIEQDFAVKGCVVRAGRASYLADLKVALENALAGVGVGAGSLSDGGAAIERFNEDAALIDELQHSIAKARFDELNGGRILCDDGRGLIRRFRRWRARRKAMRRRLPHTGIEQLQARLDRHVESARVVLEQLRADGLRNCLRRSRPELQRFLKAIRSRRAARKEELFAETPFEGILDAFPIWLAKLSEVHRVLPLREGLFDLVIIDEATQCDIASCLPVLQRAKRVLIAGDARQLRHLSFLSRARQQRLAEEFGVDPQAHHTDYREVSMLDLVSDRVTRQQQVGFLNEHYRSRPEIIAFSNRKFYAGALNVMSEGLQRSPTKAIRLIRCEAERDEGGVNQRELDLVVEQLHRIVSGELRREADRCTSIGVLSPLRAQVDAIQEAVTERFESNLFARLMTTHQLRVATAYGFQGEERDVMFLSLAVGSSGAAAALRYLSRPDVLNVAITRAREEQYIYCSFDPKALPASSLLGEYLHDVDAGMSNNVTETSLLSPDGFALEVSAELESLGFVVDCGGAVAGTRFDLLAKDHGKMLGIDLIGHPGQFEAALPIERYKMLKRAGVHVFPVAYTAWLLRRDECLAALRRAVAAL